MKSHTRKLYHIVQGKLHLDEHDGMKFIEGIQAEVKESTQEFSSKDFVHQTVAEAKSELIKWMFIFLGWPRSCNVYDRGISYKKLIITALFKYRIVPQHGED